MDASDAVKYQLIDRARDKLIYDCSRGRNTFPSNVVITIVHCLVI